MECMYDNDKTIFKYLNPNDNDMLSEIKYDDLKEILFYLNRYYLEYRDILGIDSDITFGIELELDNFRGTVYDHWPFQLELNEIVGNDMWNTKNDITLKYGREIASDVLNDSIKTWSDIDNVCSFAASYGEIAKTCSAHVHIGSQILGDNSLYWYRFFKLWSIYENIIYRFGYGEYLTHRGKINRHARPAAKFFDSRLPIIKERIDSSLIDMLNSMKPKSMSVDQLKKFGVNYWHMLCDVDYDMFDDYNVYNYGCTVEFKHSNGTFNKIIWQNEIFFDMCLMLYCKSDRFDDEILNRRKIEVEGIFSDLWAYSRIYLEQALELADMIFDNNLDKISFLRQYFKEFEVSDKCFVKARRMTM